MHDGAKPLAYHPNRWFHIDGFVQDYRNSSALAMELLSTAVLH